MDLEHVRHAPPPGPIRRSCAWRPAPRWPGAAVRRGPGPRCSTGSPARRPPRPSPPRTPAERRVRRAGLGRQDRVALDESYHALEHPDESLAAGVHDARLLQDRHQLRRAGQRALRLGEELGHELADVRGVGGGALGGGGRLPRHREDRALARVVERLVEAVRAAAQSRGDVAGRRPASRSPSASANPMRKWASMMPGVAAGTEHGGAGRGAGGVRKRRVAERAERVGDGTERQAEVGSGIAVGDREDVDPVDLVSTRRHPVGRREERARQPRPVDVGDAHRHRQATRRPPVPGLRHGPRGAAGPPRRGSPAS